ncbi:aldehyde ferredoxin oxidoreductase N-terminal domain-containing protein, partial [Deferrisoma palaeochoriense]
MRFAETGVSLEVDLTTGNIQKVPSDPKDTEMYLGGQGTAARHLWDRVGPEVEAFDPENLLIFSTGLLVGTPVPGANRTIVNTISPQTGLYAHSIFGAFFGPELKHAGYDKIIFRGKAPDLVYLWIHNDTVELRDATHLRGKGAQDTAQLIREELGVPEAQVAAIGLAGENRVFMATIEHSSASASRGVGAVMGDKRIKAIAVRGTKDIHLAHPEEIFKLSLDMFKAIGDNPLAGDIMAHEDDEEFHVDNFAWGNARERIKGYWNKEREERWKKITESVR